MLSKPPVRLYNPLLQRRFGVPAQFVQPRRIHQLAGGAVRFGVIVGNGAGVADDVLDEGGEGVDGQVLANADVEDAVGRGVAQGVLGVFEDEEDGVRQVVDVQEFAFGGAAAPERNGRVRAVGRRALRLVKLTEQCRQDVARFKVKVIVRAVEVRGHQREEIVAVLFVVGLAQLDAGDLGDRVPLVRGLQWAGEQALLRHRLRGVLRVDAGGAEKEEALDAGLVGRGDDALLDGQVVADEVGRVLVVREDAPDTGRGEYDVGGLLGGEERAGGLRVAQVQFAGRPSHEVRVPGALQPSPHGGAYHATVAGDVDRCVFVF